LFNKLSNWKQLETAISSRFQLFPAFSSRDQQSVSKKYVYYLLCLHIIITAGKSWKKLEKAGKSWKTAGNGWKRLETAGNGWKFPAVTNSQSQKSMYIIHFVCILS